MRPIKLTFDTWYIDEHEVVGKADGFGRVYPGINSIGIPIAIKVVPAEDRLSAKQGLLFAKKFARQSTKHIVPIFDYGEADDGTTYVVMDRAEQSLRDWLESNPSASDNDVVAVVGDIARGLIEAGDWAHRNLKPENVLYLDARWQLTDFGIARIGNSVSAVSMLKSAQSAPYAAPEQWNQDHATHATDIYALGCIAAEITMARKIFRGPLLEDFMQQHKIEHPNIEMISSPLRALIARMLGKPPTERPSAKQVLTAFPASDVFPETRGFLS